MIHKIDKQSLIIYLGLFLLISTQVFYIAGSLLANLSVILFGFSYIVLQSKENFFYFIKKYKIQTFLIFVCILINILNSEFTYLSSTKLILYLRFILFTFSIIFFLNIIKNKIDVYLKYLSFLIIFLIMDSLIQFYFGKDIFGYDYNKDYFRISGPFGDEWIIGNYLFNIGFLTLAYLNFFKNIDLKYNIIIILVISLTILYSGERTAYFSIYIFLLLMFIFSNKKKLILLSTIFLIFLSAAIIKQPFGDERGNYLSLKYDLTILAQLIGEGKNNNLNNNDVSDSDSINKSDEENKKLITKFFNKLKNSKWLGHYYMANKILKNNLISGSGFRTFKYTCLDYQKKEKTFGRRCSNHPHNLHLEILSDNGILGYLIFIWFISYIFYIFIKEKLYKNFGICILFCVILTFIFPFKPTGSLFTTNTSFIFWTIIGHFIFLRNLNRIN